jgi:uncharacterized membrane protein YesL
MEGSTVQFTAYSILNILTIICLYMLPVQHSFLITIQNTIEIG